MIPALLLIVAEQYNVAKILAARRCQPLAVAQVGKIEDQIVAEEGNLSGSSAGPPFSMTSQAMESPGPKRLLPVGHKMLCSHTIRRGPSCESASVAHARQTSECIAHG